MWCCRKQERSFEQSEIVQKRRELAMHAEERAREEAFKARVAERERAYAARRKDVAHKRELLLQHNMKQVCTTFLRAINADALLCPDLLRSCARRSREQEEMTGIASLMN
jgi:hypothetical protein